MKKTSRHSILVGQQQCVVSMALYLFSFKKKWVSEYKECLEKGSVTEAVPIQVTLRSPTLQNHVITA